jgi:tetratricopeptide (TPR) repeat protein
VLTRNLILSDTDRRNSTVSQFHRVTLMASSSGPLPAPLNADLSAFESHPLFMRSLPEEYAEDAALSALQNLAHAGTPDGAYAMQIAWMQNCNFHLKEIAQNFKEQGNEYFKGKRFREAEGFYTQGINSNPSDTHLREALLNNRAACNLEMSMVISPTLQLDVSLVGSENYGRALRDCSLALTLNKYSSKAYYRSAFALLALNRLEEALDCCHRCLTFDIDNTAVKALKVQVSTAKEEKVRTETLEFNRKRKEAEKRRLIKEALDVGAIFRSATIIHTSHRNVTYCISRRLGGRRWRTTSSDRTSQTGNQALSFFRWHAIIRNIA